MKPKYLWKSMQAGMKSAHGNIEWKIGEWQKEEKAVKCSVGFHASERVVDAMRFVNMEVLAKVEVRGKCDKEADKQCWTEMRIIEAWHWKKEDSVALAIFAAEQVIDIYEKENPTDTRPREAIEAAKKWLAEPTEASRKAAEAAAWAARAAWAAADADKILDKCEAFIQNRIKTLEPYVDVSRPEPKPSRKIKSIASKLVRGHRKAA